MVLLVNLRDMEQSSWRELLSSFDDERLKKENFSFLDSLVQFLFFVPFSLAKGL
ncbi:MAG TPA: hypothetical protein VJC21_02115 [Candidatus Nanoarchaeia archaeon]|nr:hypothetical protein [Candidatus Nanoarchaeia archaeon]